MIICENLADEKQDNYYLCEAWSGKGKRKCRNKAKYDYHFDPEKIKNGVNPEMKTQMVCKKHHAVWQEHFKYHGNLTT